MLCFIVLIALFTSTYCYPFNAKSLTHGVPFTNIVSNATWLGFPSQENKLLYLSLESHTPGAHVQAYLYTTKIYEVYGIQSPIGPSKVLSAKVKYFFFFKTSFNEIDLCSC